MNTKKRKYNSSRRARAKEETVTTILESAVKLHSQGITSIEMLANDAGVSVASVRKHFPTREALFRGCTDHFSRRHIPPSPELWAGKADRSERIQACVNYLFPYLEVSMGVVWLAYRLEDEIQVMKENVSNIEQYLDAAVNAVLTEANQEPETKKAVRFILHPLTYRNMRVQGGFQPDECVRFSSNMLARYIK